MTNYEKIISGLNPEKLAKLIIHIPDCKLCPLLDECGLFKKDWNCQHEVKKWLEQEAEDERL